MEDLGGVLLGLLGGLGGPGGPEDLEDGYRPVDPAGGGRATRGAMATRWRPPDHGERDGGAGAVVAEHPERTESQAAGRDAGEGVFEGKSGDSNAELPPRADSMYQSSQLD